ncbi:MAG: MATE family efflux transporter [Gemmatimonadetes bacterium]|nr:MAG: MATE family efflux transporter [Gemmatimonadota bacterium]
MSKKLDLHHISYRTIWSLAWPVILGQVLQTTFTVVDMKFIAMLGTSQAAAAAVSGSLTWTLFSLMGMISAGTTAVISRRMGEDRPLDAGLTAFHSLILALVMGLLVGTTGLTFVRELLDLFGTTPDVTAHALLYLNITFLGTPVLVMGMVLSAAFQAAGDTQRPMQLFALANAINLILDPLLMFGKFGFPAMGIKGAALATVIAQLISVSILLFILYTPRSPIPMPRLRDSRLDKALFWLLIKIGFPTGIQNTARPITGNVTFKIVALYGTDALAAFGFGMRALSFCWLFLGGFIVASSALVGQSLGAGLPESAERAVKKSVLVVTLIAGLFFLFYGFGGKYAIMIFSTEANVLRIGASYLLIVGLGMIFTAPGAICQAGFTGAGDTRPPMVISLIANWGLKLPAALICAYVFHLSIDWIWGAVSLSMIFEGGTMALWFRRGRWKEIKLK